MNFAFPFFICLSLFSAICWADTPAQNPTANTLPLLPTTASALATATPNHPIVTPPPPAVSAQGYILVDSNSGKILAQSNQDTRMPPASLTKMMTAYIISDAIKQGRIHFDDKVPISEKAWRMGGSKMFVKVGDMVSVRDLLQGIIVQSGNDACIAMAEHLAGSEDSFINIMNQQAKLLGMTNTHYTDCTGMPNPNHYTTPRDISILANAMIKNFPEDYKWYSQKWYTYNNIKQPNRNLLLWRDPEVDGIKTGHTDDAGFCLAASAQKNGTRLISVVMGEPSTSDRATDSEKLLVYGARFFETKPVYTANIPISTPAVWLGKQKSVPIGVAQSLYITTPTGDFKNIKSEFTLPEPLKAPIKNGQVLGQVQATLNGKVVATQPIIALADVPKANIFSRMRDHMQLLIRHIIGSPDIKKA